MKHWFDESGAPALGDLDHHYPYNDLRARGHLQWDPPTAQEAPADYLQRWILRGSGALAPGASVPTPLMVWWAGDAVLAINAVPQGSWLRTLQPE